MPGESHDRPFLTEHNMPSEPTSPGLASVLAAPTPPWCLCMRTRVMDSATYCLSSVHWLLGETKSHLSFFLIDSDIFSFLVLLLFLPTHPPPFLSLPSFFFPFPFAGGAERFMPEVDAFSSLTFLSHPYFIFTVFFPHFIR